MNISAWPMRRKAVLALGGALAAVALAASPAIGDDGGRPYIVPMTGAEEVANGDPNGTGTAEFQVNPGQNEICYRLEVAGVEGTIIAAHIHRAPSGVAGPIVVPLGAPVTGSSAGCAAVDRALAQDIVVNPADYYVNVHTNVRPAGAVRGQLSR